MENVKVVMESDYPTVRLIREFGGDSQAFEPGGIVDLSDRFRATLTSGAGYFAPARLRLRMTYDGWYESAVNIDTLVIPEILPEPDAVEVLDGRTFTFKVFRQRGNQGGGDVIERHGHRGQGKRQRNAGTGRGGDDLGTAGPGDGSVRQEHLASLQGLRGITLDHRSRPTSRKRSSASGQAPAKGRA